MSFSNVSPSSLSDSTTPWGSIALGIGVSCAIGYCLLQRGASHEKANAFQAPSQRPNSPPDKSPVENERKIDELKDKHLEGRCFTVVEKITRVAQLLLLTTAQGSISHDSKLQLKIAALSGDFHVLTKILNIVATGTLERERTYNALLQLDKNEAKQHWSSAWKTLSSKVTIEISKIQDEVDKILGQITDTLSQSSCFNIDDSKLKDEFKSLELKDVDQIKFVSLKIVECELNNIKVLLGSSKKYWEEIIAGKTPPEKIFEQMKTLKNIYEAAVDYADHNAYDCASYIPKCVLLEKDRDDRAQLFADICKSL